MKLLLMNNPALRTVCSPVEEGDMPDILSKLDEMKAILLKEEGVALAANQVGIFKRFFLMRGADGIYLVVNPEITIMSDPKPYDEGCLSIPGTYAEITRYHAVQLQFKNEKFEDVLIELDGIHAVAVQHEIDHLDGKLYIDQLKPMKRALVLKKHKSYMNSRGRR